MKVAKRLVPADQRRNLNPTAPAYVAMALFGKRYSEQRGGSMEFWDSLSDYERQTCIQLAEQVRAAPMAEQSTD